MVEYEVIATGSSGNAVVLNRVVMVDCGVSFESIAPVFKRLQLVLLTHIHSDHFNKSTIRRLSFERPTLRFACCRWLVEPLLKAGVAVKNVDVLEVGKWYDYRICSLSPVRLTHNVENCGYKLHFPTGKVFYATDTGSLAGIQAENYDLYMVEANHMEAEIQERIRGKQALGVFAYESQAAKNHLSKEKCDAFIYENIGAFGRYVYLHPHREHSGQEDLC